MRSLEELEPLRTELLKPAYESLVIDGDHDAIKKIINEKNIPQRGLRTIPLHEAYNFVIGHLATTQEPKTIKKAIQELTTNANPLVKVCAESFMDLFTTPITKGVDINNSMVVQALNLFESVGIIDSTLKNSFLDLSIVNISIAEQLYGVDCSNITSEEITWSWTRS